MYLRCFGDYRKYMNTVDSRTGEKQLQVSSHTHSHTYALTHTYTHTHTHTHTHSHTHTHTYTHLHTRTHTHTHIRTHTYALTHTHAHSYTPTCCMCEPVELSITSFLFHLKCSFIAVTCVSITFSINICREKTFSRVSTTQSQQSG